MNDSSFSTNETATDVATDVATDINTDTSVIEPSVSTADTAADTAPDATTPAAPAACTAAGFAALGIPEQILNAIKDLGYENPTPVQSQAFPVALEGKDILATAQTGTGKTAAFVLPLLKRMMETKLEKVLVIAPTREIAEQIGRVITELTTDARRFRSAVIIGGASYYKQMASLRVNPVFIVGTPGRLLDQVERGNIDLKSFTNLVIDEADRLLDMGFLPQLRSLVMHMPRERQTMMFSATMPPEIQSLAANLLKDPVRITVGAVSKPVDKIVQSIVKTTSRTKDGDLMRSIDEIAGAMIVFVRTKSRAERVATLLLDAGHKVVRLHGDRSQIQRSTAVEAVRMGRARILVATDIAARGLDIPVIRHVLNYDLPMAAEDYVHRIGRTARAGADGTSISFVTPEEERLWARIHKLIYGRYPDEGKGDGRRKDSRPAFMRGGGNREDRRSGGRSSGGRFGARAPFTGDRPARPSYGDRPSFGDRPSRPAFGDRPAKSNFGERSERPAFGDRPSRPAFGDRPSRPAFGDRPAKASFGDRPSKPSFGDRSPKADFGDRPATDTFGDRPKTRAERRAGLQKSASEGGFLAAKRERKEERPARTFKKREDGKTSERSSDKPMGRFARLGIRKDGPYEGDQMDRPKKAFGEKPERTGGGFKGKSGGFGSRSAKPAGGRPQTRFGGGKPSGGKSASRAY